MLKLNSVPPFTLAGLAEAHYDILNSKIKTGNNKGRYRKNALSYKIGEAITRHSGETKRFFEFLNSNIASIIKGDPYQLRSIINDFHRLFPNITFSETNGKNQLVFNALGKEVEDIFNYTNYRGSAQCTNHLAALGLATRITCPYCNFDELSIVELHPDAATADSHRALLDLDHFFSKSRYPFLGISLFNLIPSCHNCNSRFKGSKEFNITTHVHPYLHSFEDLFIFKLAAPYLPDQSAEDLEIKFDARTRFPDNLIKDLHLIERYNTARKSLIEMLQFLYKKPFENFCHVTGQTQDEESKREFFRFGKIPPVKEELINYSLGKLKRDICIDLNILSAE